MTSSNSNKLPELIMWKDEVLNTSSYFIEMALSIRFSDKEFLKMIAGIFRTVSTRDAIPLPSTFPDFTLTASEIQSSLWCSTAVAVGDIFGFEKHVVSFINCPSNLNPHRRLFFRISLLRCQINRTAVAFQSTVSR